MSEPVLRPRDAFSECQNLSRVRRAFAVEQALGVARELQSVLAGKAERETQRAFGQLRQGRALLLCSVGEKPRQRIRDKRFIQRLQVEPLATRADRGEQPAGCVADE